MAELLHYLRLVEELMALATSPLESFFKYRPAHILERIANFHHLSPATAEKRFVECLKLLALNVLDPGEVHVPSKKVDKVWHTFVLHTPEYRDFCLAVLGGFADHSPCPVTPELVASYHRTIDQLERHFGPVDRELWPRQSAADCEDDCSSCGDCNCAGYHDGKLIDPSTLLRVIHG